MGKTHKVITNHFYHHIHQDSNMITTKDIDTLIRQVKIDMITEEPNSTLEWFMDLWTSLSFAQIDVYRRNAEKEIIYYKMDNDRINKIAVFYIDYNNNYIYYDFIHYSSYFYSLEYLETKKLQEITTLLLSIVLPGNSLIPIEIKLEELEEIKNALNNIK